jgi:hypothetical protein
MRLDDSKPDLLYPTQKSRIQTVAASSSVIRLVSDSGVPVPDSAPFRSPLDASRLVTGIFTANIDSMSLFRSSARSSKLRTVSCIFWLKSIHWANSCRSSSTCFLLRSRNASCAARFCCLRRSRAWGLRVSYRIVFSFGYGSLEERVFKGAAKVEHPGVK